ncbi:DUF3179 domain-containing (seleno)protein [Aquimarina agarivorans]|uniref:DUF3179 domain-containing (seleno)protein n=1 Tax=Aquimarina agarivorans TaxID=980584 RepID=UPI000248E744|nr:DUF3179 domain-containing (seleno)protein [Aquimarina agarivorans]
MKNAVITFLFVISLSLYGSEIQHQNLERNFNLTKKAKFEYFLDLFKPANTFARTNTFKQIRHNWQSSDEILLVETLYFIDNNRIRQQLLQILKEHTNLNAKASYNDWYIDIWNRPECYNSNYFTFKAKLHSLIDPKFSKYFYNRAQLTKIRLDEVRWGGVKQDGIPPLRNPKMISAEKATYLNNNDIVFGIEINGKANAYPKRILAWHELFTDTIGNTPVAGVYCTLCGTVILYKTLHKGVQYQLGTSDFLYRSNKLMYDQKKHNRFGALP